MVCLEQDLLLGLGILDLVFVNQDILVYSLHGVEPTSFLVHYKEHLSEGTLVDQFPNFEILKSAQALLLRKAFASH
jgi:hypothetical protein